MAHIHINSNPGSAVRQVLINGSDVTAELFDDAELVEVGEGDLTEFGFRVTYAVGKLTVDNEANVALTDHFPEAAALVRSALSEDVA